MVVAVGTPDLPDSGTTRGDPQDENKSGILRESPSFPFRDKGFVKQFIEKEIGKQVIRRKLAKQRHLIVLQGIQPEYLTDHLFPIIQELFDPQQVTYNGGIAKVPRWKISCYLEVLPGGIPCTRPNTELLHHCLPLLESCNYLFSYWYRQQHACNRANQSSLSKIRVERLMTFVTRYTPKPGEQALLKHIDGAGKVDGSIVVALPSDDPFEGGGLTFWDGKDERKQPLELHYDTRAGDIAFIDRAVWHQADPITSGTRWALVIFYKVHKNEST